MKRTLVLIAAVAALGGAPAEPQDNKAWAEALAVYQKFSASRDPIERRRAAEDLGTATTEKHDKVCWQLISNLLRAELAREGANGKSEEKVSGEVLEGCLSTMRKISGKDAVAEMLKTAKAKAEHPRVRAYAIWGLVDRAELKDVIELADDKNPIIQVAAVDVLCQRARLSLTPTFLRLIGEPRTWEVKLLALQGLEKTGDIDAVEPLIDGLAHCHADEGRLKIQYMRVLQKLLDIDLETDEPNAWKSAWAAHKSGSDQAPGSTVVDATEFYGLKTRSTRLVFVLDRTGSMAEPGSEPPRSIFKLPTEATGGEKEPPQERAARDEATKIQKKWAALAAKTRIDVAKKELINTIYVLNPKVHFNVVWYESTPTPWRQELVPATWANKLECLREADKIGPGGSTNIWDALELALKMIEQAQGKQTVVALDKRVNYAAITGGADTLYLMTDGRPNSGRLDKPEDIITEIRKVNRLRKVVIHTICVGDVLPGAAAAMDNPDPAFLKKIADENGGEFIHIRK